MIKCIGSWCLCHHFVCCTAARDRYSSSPEAAGPMGPHCPDWIRQASHLDKDINPTNRHSIEEPRPKAGHNTRLAIKAKGISKEKKDKQHKKAKKKKKKHRHKLCE